MKKFLAIAMIISAAVVAKADLFLYWMVPSDAWEGAQYAALMGNTGSGYTQLGSKVAIGDVADTLIGSYTDYVINLFTYNGTWNVVANSIATYTYDDLVATGATYEDLGDKTQQVASPYSFSGFTATIPEPTSGLLVLLGLAGLALKRRV